MKELNYKFIISNIVTAVVLFFSVPYYKSSFAQFHESGSAPLYGYTVMIVVILGMIATMLKAHNVAYRSKNSIQWHGRLFLLLLYLCSFIANIVLLNIALRMIGFTLKDNIGGVVFFFFALLVGFIALILESHHLQHRPKNPLPAKWDKPITLASTIYSGLGISLCWNHFVAADPIHFTNTAFAILSHVVLMFILVFPFQRLFWYEVIADSESRVDNLKTIGAIALVFVSGILPLFLPV